MEIVPESIFISSIRTFSRMFFGVIGLLIALFLCSIVYSVIAPSPLMEEKTELSILPDATGKRELAPANAPAILQISIHGVIGDPQRLTDEVIENILIDSRNNLLSHDRVKGILLHFDTPGGGATDSDSIYRMLKTYKERYKIPIFGYVDGLCASGGMYIASAADQVFAGPSSTIGSVGVIIGPFFNFFDAMGKIGVQARTISQGIDKDMMNPTRPWKEGEDASLKAVTAFMYNRFVNVVTEARPRLDANKLVNEYGAQVFDCVKAQELGYVDQAMSTRDDALLALLQAANIDPEKPYQVVSLTPKRDWLPNLVSSQSPLFSGKIEHSLDLGIPQFRGAFAYLYQIGNE